uniref:Proteasomal ATPase OB C-terminal domain-containing protein n=1 Tax=Romanomermis culicivorax TaxID=13658 RepID=A0A915KMG5_ROMCU
MSAASLLETRMDEDPPASFSDKDSKESMKDDAVKSFFKSKIMDLEHMVIEKSQNLRRLQAQRNELNAKVRALKEEIALLQEPGSNVGEVVKVMDKKKVLVKIHPEGKYVVDLDKNIEAKTLVTNARVALRADSYSLHKVLPNKVNRIDVLRKYSTPIFNLKS